MFLGRRLSPLHLLSVVCALLPSLVWADKIYLKSGDVVTGTIIEETPDNVRIQVLVGTIKDKRSISRVSIERIEKTTPEDVERDACVPLKLTPDGLPAKGYEERLKIVNEFLAKFPTSKYLAEIQGVRDSLTSELERVKAGESRFRGNWLTPDQQAIQTPNLEANTALRLMRQAAAGRNFLGALRQFEFIEKFYGGTLAYPQAVTDAKRILPAYGQQLTKEIEFARYDAAQNAKGLAALSESARAAAQQEIAAASARYKALVAAEKEKKIAWLSVDMKSEASLNEGIARVRKEIERIGKIDTAALDLQAQAFYDVGELIYAGKLDEAKPALSAATGMKGGAKLASTSKTASSKSATPGGPADRPSILASLQQQLEERLQKRANAAKLAALTAEAAAKEATTASGTAKDGTTPAVTGDEALDALVMQRKTTADEETPAKESASAKGKPERKTSATRPSAKATASSDEDETGTTERPARPAAPVARAKSGGSPLPIIIGIVAVCLVGVTVFLFIQEKKKSGGGS